MKKVKATKEILKEWRKFENKQNLNETQGSNAAISRVKHKPSKEAKDLKNELEAIYGKDIFYCYDNFDEHGDEEMISEEYGYQIEIESLTDHVKGMSQFPSDISVSDIVMSEDDLIYEAGLDRGIGVSNEGSFEVPWPILHMYTGNAERYYYGEIDINGRKQKVVYKDSHGYTVYYTWASKSASGSLQNKKTFKNKQGSAWG